MLYVYLGLVGLLCFFVLRNMFQEKNFMAQLSYALLAIPLLLRLLAVK